MTYKQFIIQCQKMKDLGWKAWKSPTNSIFMKKSGDNWITNPLCAVCSEVCEIGLSTSAGAARELKLGSRVTEWISNAIEYPSNALQDAPSILRCRRELLAAFKLKKDK